MTQASTSLRPPYWLIGVGLAIAFCFAYLPLPFFSFYKEWIFVMLVGLAMLLLKPQGADPAFRRHPLVIAAAAIAAVLVVQALLDAALWPRVVLTLGYLAFFVLCVKTGRLMSRQPGVPSLEWLAWIILAAVLALVASAALQLNWIEFQFPLVQRRTADHRIASNIAQANHFADVLWLGAVCAVFLRVRGRLTAPTAWALVVLFQAFSHFTGSRMVWLYAIAVALLGLASLLRRPQSDEVRRFSRALVLMGVVFPLVGVVAMMSGVLDLFGIGIGAERMVSATGEAASNQRLWFWRVAIDAVRQHPVLGVGVGHYVGHGYEMVMRLAEGPPAGADSNAHNVFLHLAAELGLPLALVVAGCFVWWVLRCWRKASVQLDTLVVMALSGLIWIHANLEYPLWYAYFLGLLGLLAGHAGEDASSDAAPVPAGRGELLLVRGGPLALMAGAMVVYLNFGHLERAMQQVIVQVEVGGVPLADEAVQAELAGLPAWSPFRDYAEAIALITASPTRATAPSLADRCEAAARLAPSPYLLARCTGVVQVAGRDQRANEFAQGFCKLYPNRSEVLVDSLSYIDTQNPGLGTVRAPCLVTRD